MRSFDYDAVTYDGAVYCTGCLPKGITSDHTECYPIFADSEWDHYPMCDHCQEVHDYVSLTSYGQAHLRVEEIITGLGITGSERFDARDEATVGLYWWCVDHHKGQWSEEYAWQCALQHQPGANERGPELGSMAALAYAWLCEDKGCEHEEEGEDDEQA